MTDSIARLRAAGVSVWPDDLSHKRLTTGSLAELRDRGVSGVTTNPTIFAKAITDGDAYDGQVRDLKLRKAPADQARRPGRADGCSGHLRVPDRRRPRTAERLTEGGSR